MCVPACLQEMEEARFEMEATKREKKKAKILSEAADIAATAPATQIAGLPFAVAIPLPACSPHAMPSLPRIPVPDGLEAS